MEFLGSLIECYCRRSVDMKISIKEKEKNFSNMALLIDFVYTKFFIIS